MRSATRSRIASGSIHGTDSISVWLQIPPNQPPIAMCQSVTVAAGPDCMADASIDNGSYDPDPGDTITLTQSPPGRYPLGNTLVTLTVTDNHGESAFCEATVTVVDTTPPAIACPPDMVVDATSPAGATVDYPAAAASDNCGTPSLGYSQVSGTVFPIGDTTVTVTATDADGNIASCQFTVHVNGALEQVCNLIGYVRELPIHRGIKVSLLAKLIVAHHALNRGHERVACLALQAFLQEVRALRDKKLTPAQADHLIADAARVRAVIGCR